MARMNDICRDMTECKRAEEKLRAVVDAAPNAMIITDGEGRIVQVNRQAEHLFGYPREELVGSPVEILVPGQFRAAFPASRGIHGRAANPADGHGTQSLWAAERRQ